MNYFFSGKKYNFVHFERLFKMHEIKFFIQKIDFFRLISPVNLGRAGLP